MIKNNIIVIMDETGSLLTEPIGMLRANANYSSTISLITPFDIEDTASITYSKSNRLNDDITQYLIPNGNLKGKDLLNETNPLYQTVHDWNVFEIGVNKKALAYIAKYRSGILYGSIGIGEIMQPVNAKNYKGTFGDTLLPELAEEFDYYICDRYNHFDKDILWTINDYAYFYNGKWNKSNYKGLAVSSTFEMPVDPNLPADFEITQDDDLAVLLAGRVAVLEQEMIATNIRIDDLQNDMTLSVKIDNETITRNELNELRVSEEVITDINSRTKNTDFLAYQQLVQGFLNGKLDKKPDGFIDLITPLNKIDVRYLDSDTELFIVVLSLPAIGIPNKIYLVPKSESETQNLYDEFIYLENKWEKLGTITINLSNYYNKQDIDALLNNKVDKVSGKGLSTNDFTNVLKDKLEGIDISQLYGGKNIGPDLLGKEYLGNGEYLVYNRANIITNYNVFDGIYNPNGNFSATASWFLEIPVVKNKTYTITYLPISNNGFEGNIYFEWDNGGSVSPLSINSSRSFTIENINSDYIRISLYGNGNYDFNFKLQIEEGSVATPYTLPMITTPEYIRQTQTPRLIYSNSGTSSGTDITFSYVDNSMKVGDVYKVHSQLTYDNAELTQREVNDLIISDTVNNNIEKNHYAKTQHSATTKINYDYATKTITMIGDFNTGDSSNSFNIRLYKVGY